MLSDDRGQPLHPRTRAIPTAVIPGPLGATSCSSLFWKTPSRGRLQLREAGEGWLVGRGWSAMRGRHPRSLSRATSHPKLESRKQRCSVQETRRDAISHAEAGQAAKRVAEQIDHHEGKEQRLLRRDLRLEKLGGLPLGIMESQGPTTLAVYCTVLSSPHAGR